ncbi:carboxyl-terminal processing protease [Acetitomaculum ruminis DSM 5522]|uniref:Carboxyl-terminal processing protease n=1 Tax=Acetitomaculum ruminis DSM 5522 TaxID=1120918 RepID=A0A1I0XDR1_9FIRM|nr:S41 family peptidase [Acetitomaculum ruminis]SFA98398.1 carboxyl-terminal processing protease [Acetitomaculum ruminis DSM 5522]
MFKKNKDTKDEFLSEILDSDEKNKSRIELEKQLIKEYKKGFRQGIFFVIISLLAAFLGIKLSFIIIFGNNVDLSLNFIKLCSKIQTIENFINKYYLDDVDSEQVEAYIYKGLMAGLGDKYAAYYTADEYEKEKSLSEGTYEGIGIVITKANSDTTAKITKVYSGSPAETAGIVAGDQIVKIDGSTVEKMTSKEIVELISKSDKEINLSVYRSSNDRNYSFKVSSDSVEIITVNSKMLEDNVGYIQITEFDTITETQFDDAINDLKDQGMKSLVFDLRDNPGGNVSTVVDIMDKILPEGKIVYFIDKNGNEKDYNSDAENYMDIPMSVIVNGNSASASEIFAGAIKDYKLGKIVGTTTYGKGIVQNVIGLKDGSAIKLTVAKYYTPNGICIHQTGITPDVEVEVGEEDEKDTQLEAAIKALGN